MIRSISFQNQFNGWFWSTCLIFQADSSLIQFEFAAHLNHSRMEFYFRTVSHLQKYLLCEAMPFVIVIGTRRLIEQWEDLQQLLVFHEHHELFQFFVDFEAARSSSGRLVKNVLGILIFRDVWVSLKPSASNELSVVAIRNHAIVAAMLIHIVYHKNFILCCVITKNILFFLVLVSP